MSLAQQLDSAAWTPGVPLVKTARWSLTGTGLSGHIRRSAVDLAGWTGRVELDAAGLVLKDAESREEVARVQEVRKHLRTLTTGGRRYEVTTRSLNEPVRVVEDTGRQVLKVGMPVWRRRLPLTVAADLEDSLALHLTALVSVMAVRLLNNPATRGAA